MDKNKNNPLLDFFKYKVESELKKNFEDMEDFEDLGRRVTDLIKRKKRQWQDYQKDQNPPGKNDKAKEPIIITVNDEMTKKAEPVKDKEPKTATSKVPVDNPAKKETESEDKKSASATVKIKVKDNKKLSKKKKTKVDSEEIQKLNREFEMQLDLLDGRYRITLEQLEIANELTKKAMKKEHKKKIKKLKRKK